MTKAYPTLFKIAFLGALSILFGLALEGQFPPTSVWQNLVELMVSGGIVVLPVFFLFGISNFLGSKFNTVLANRVLDNKVIHLIAVPLPILLGTLSLLLMLFTTEGTSWIRNLSLFLVLILMIGVPTIGLFLRGMASKLEHK